MARQMSFAETEFSKGMKKSRKGSFLECMDRIVPWQALCQIIDEYYVKEPEKAGRRPYPLETMFRIHLMQHWFNLSDRAWRVSFMTAWPCVNLRILEAWIIRHQMKQPF